MADGKVLCAVDFGTTYSGVAYDYVEKDADVGIDISSASGTRID